ncbi:DUF3201 domain-containing protein [Thermococcus aggregans]|uniref:DUF3201 domain-containing protein n=1 Tax=Thermococcus aggregans TaxID=110163 RepID=A0A9E7MYS9_THEAG|nr:DUF3201 domain-containing protein [Thermococcus aggregans]USS41211.1 DUF3201 domain-containing protein [Thermococcus aggregans]
MKLIEIHNHLNRIWSEIFRLNEVLREKLRPLGFKVEPVEEVFNAYIFLEGEWREMVYPHPAFEIKPQGEVGATIQSFYFVFAIPKEKITRDFVFEFLKKFLQSYIYGTENFLEDIYNHNSPRNPEEVYREIEKSQEEVFQFEVEAKDSEELENKLFEFIELAKKYKVLDL